MKNIDVWFIIVQVAVMFYAILMPHGMLDAMITFLAVTTTNAVCYLLVNSYRKKKALCFGCPYSQHSKCQFKNPDFKKEIREEVKKCSK